MDNLAYERSGNIGILRINRPQVLNALNKTVLEQLLILIDMLTRGQQVKALILTGEGDKAFISGADIKEMQALDNTDMLRFCELGQQVANALENAQFITISAVNGYALGGGLEIALATDFIFATKNAKFGLPEVTLGLIPGFGGTQRLTRKIGPQLSKELILTGKTITAEEAKTYGIVSRICEKETLLNDAQVLAEQILKNPFKAILQAKRAINQAYQLGISEGLEAERNMCTVCFSTGECKERMESFLEKKGKENHAAR